MCRFSQIQTVKPIIASILWWVCIGLVTLGCFILPIYLPLSWDGFIMRLHDVYLFCGALKIDVFASLVAAREGFFLLVGMRRRALLSLLSYDFTLFWRVSGDMQHTYLIWSGGIISRMACIASSVISSAALIGVGWRGGRFSLFLPTITGTVGFFPLSIFRRFSSLVHCFR